MLCATETADLVRQRKKTAQDVLEECIEQINAKNPALVAFVHMDIESATESAQEIDRKIANGEDPGPLAGVPFGIKDTHDCKGMPTTFGSEFYRQSENKANDAVYVDRLRKAGGIPLGKTAAAEFGLDSGTSTYAFGVTRNPWNPRLTPGGSSGGSAAAVASGMVPFCTSGDAGGSTRSPASFTGLVGLKPSLGRIPNASGFDIMPCIGALTTTVRDTARFLDITSGPDDSDHLTLPKTHQVYETEMETLSLDGIRAAWSPDLGYAIVDPEILSACEEAVARLKSVIPVVMHQEPVSLENCYLKWARLVINDVIGHLEDIGAWPDKKDLLSNTPRHYIEKFSATTRRDCSESRDALIRLERQVADLFQKVDILITPGMATLPHQADALEPETLLGHDITGQGATAFGAMANICGNPAISIPVGISKSGVPIGIQIMAKRHREDILLRIAHIMETNWPWPRHAED